MWLSLENSICNLFKTSSYFRLWVLLEDWNLSVEVYANIAFASGRTELILVFHSVEIYISDTFAYGRSKLIMGFHTAEVAKKEKKY